jgi:hypothetical protein
MIDSWPGLLLPLWLALIFEPTKEHKKITENPPKVIKINKEQSKIDTTLILKIKN